MEEKNKRFMSFLYSTFMSFQKDYSKFEASLVRKDSFVSFVKQFVKDMSEVAATDMFMHLAGRLKQLSQMLNNPLSSFKGTDDFNESGMGSHLDNSNADLHQSFISNMQSIKISTYNMTAQEMADLAVNPWELDKLYENWAEKDESLADVMNVKIIRQKNADFRLKVETWQSRKKERKANHKRSFT